MIPGDSTTSTGGGAGPGEHVNAWIRPSSTVGLERSSGLMRYVISGHLFARCPPPISSAFFPDVDAIYEFRLAFTRHPNIAMYALERYLALSADISLTNVSFTFDAQHSLGRSAVTFRALDVISDPLPSGVEASVDGPVPSWSLCIGGGECIVVTHPFLVQLYYVLLHSGVFSSSQLEKMVEVSHHRTPFVLDLAPRPVFLDYNISRCYETKCGACARGGEGSKTGQLAASKWKEIVGKWREVKKN